jgi:hypothetical protein
MAAIAPADRLISIAMDRVLRQARAQPDRAGPFTGTVASPTQNRVSTRQIPSRSPLRSSRIRTVDPSMKARQS